VQSDLDLAFPMSQFLHRPTWFCMKTQYPGKSNNFPLMFLVYDKLLWKEIRENSTKDIYLDFYKEKGKKIKENRKKLEY